MAKAYGKDLRLKVLEAIENNSMKPDEVSEQFNLGRSTIYDWLALKAETGGVSPRPHSHSGYGHKITDWAAFKAFVVANGDKTQAEMAELWPGDISARTISRALKKIGFTRKKDLRV